MNSYYNYEVDKNEEDHRKKHVNYKLKKGLV